MGPGRATLTAYKPLRSFDALERLKALGAGQLDPLRGHAGTMALVGGDWL